MISLFCVSYVIVIKYVFFLISLAILINDRQHFETDNDGVDGRGVDEEHVERILYYADHY